MRLEVSTAPGSAPDGPLMFRVVLLNDGFSPVSIFRNALVGPTLQRAGQMPGPLSVEPTYGAEEEPILLQPFAFYGRDRFFDDLEAAGYVVSAEYAVGGDRLTARLELHGPGRPHGHATAAGDLRGGGR
jgi:hypothetical protein